MRLYTPKEVMQVIDIPRKTFDQWIMRLIVKPTVRADGPGTVNKFSRSDILSMAIVRKLSECGMPLKKAELIAEPAARMHLRKNVNCDIIAVNLEKLPTHKIISPNKLNVLPYPITLTVDIRPISSEVLRRIEDID